MESLTEIRKKFHQRPELVYTEFWTTAEICRHLESYGYDLILGKELYQEDLRVNVPSQEVLEKWYQNAVDLGAETKYLEKMRGGYTGVIGVLDSGKPGPTLAFRGDIDALPIQESGDPEHLPAKQGWASKHEGIMHACGHDVHLTMALGVARYLAEHRDALRGEFVVIFSAAEEGGKSCLSLSKLPIVDEIGYMLTYHVGTFPFGRRHVLLPGVYFRSIETFRVTFSSRESTADEMPSETVETAQADDLTPIDRARQLWKTVTSMPDRTNGALNAACAAILNMHAIPRRPDGQARLTVHQLHAGVQKEDPFFLPVPNPCWFDLTVRGDTQEISDYMVQGVTRVLRAAAEMHDVDITMEKTNFYPPWNYNSPFLTRLAIEAWEEMGRGDAVIAEPNGEFGTDDVFFIMHKVIGSGGHAMYLGLGSDDDGGRMRNIHDPDGRFDIVPDVMDAGVALATTVFERILKEE